MTHIPHKVKDKLSISSGYHHYNSLMIILNIFLYSASETSATPQAKKGEEVRKTQNIQTKIFRTNELKK